MAKKIKPYNIFKCLTCKDNKQYEFKEMQEHLKTVHGLKDLTKAKFKKEMIMHMDGTDWYSSTYKLTHKKVILQQECLNKRDEEGQAYWK